MAVQEKKPTRTLQYPLNEPNYKGYIQFSVLNEQNSNRKALKQFTEAARKKLETITSVGAAKDAAVDGAQAIADFISGQAKEVFTNKDKQAFDGQDNTKQPIVTRSRFSPTDKQCRLYLPVGLQFRDNASYSGVDLGVTGAAVSGGAGIFGGISTIANSLRSGVSNDVATAAVVQALDKASFSSLGTVANAGFRLGIGVTVNPNTRTLFEKVGVREFAFTFKFFAESRKEAQEVEDIIQFFRSELYPEEIIAPGTRDLSIGYRFPKKFGIRIYYDNQEIANKILPCHLRDISTNYNPANMSFHDDGKFNEIDMTLSFTEIRTLSKKDIVEGGF